MSKPKRIVGSPQKGRYHGTSRSARGARARERLAGLAGLAGLALACGACGAGNGAWPGRPTPLGGAPRPAVLRAPEDDAFLAKLRGDHPGPHPPKLYWTSVPAWEPVKSLVGASLGRRTTGVVAVRVARHASARDKWPDLCVYEELTLRQDLLVGEAGEAGAFGPPRVERVVVRAEVDCAVYDAISPVP